MRPLIAVMLLLVSCSGWREKSCRAIADEGWKLYESGDLGRARELLEKGVKTHPDGACSWRLRSILADTLVLRRELKPALQLTSGDPPAGVDVETRFRLQLAKGYALGMSGELKPGLKLIEVAAEIARRQKKPVWSAEAALRLANLQGLSDPREAEAGLREAIAMATEAGAKRLAVDASLALSFTLIKQERLIEAERLLDASLTKARTLGLTASEARILANLSPIYLHWGEYQRALETLVAVERIASQRGMVQERVGALQNLGNVQYLLRNTKAAASYLDQAIELTRELKTERQEASLLFNRSRIALDLEDYPMAEKSLAACYALRKKLKDQDAEWSYQLRLAQLLRARGKYEEADRKLKLLEHERLSPSVQWRVEGERAQVAEGAGRYADAERHYENSLQIMANQSKTLQSAAAQVSFTSGNVGMHHQYVRYLADRGRPLRALEVADWSRSAADHQRPPAFTVEGLKAAAKRRQATVLVYWVAPRQSLVWVITPRRFEMLTLPPDDVIRQMVERASGKELFEKLVAPVLGEAERGGNVIVVPDGPLQQVNPEVFETDNGYWIQSATLVRANSMASLMGTAPTDVPRTLLAIGDSDAPAKDFPKLTNSGPEIEEVARHFDRDRVKTFRGAMATADAYLGSKPQSYGYIHFATHAVADVRAPMESALILSPSPSGYRLRAADIAACPIRANLVSLASCQSAGARVSSGGLLGVAWAFLRAGAGAVVASLHDVDDRASRQLSADLYGGMKDGLSAAQALRSAKLKMMGQKQFAMADHWGAYILIVGK